MSRQTQTLARSLSPLTISPKEKMSAWLASLVLELDLGLATHHTSAQPYDEHNERCVQCRVPRILNPPPSKKREEKRNAKLWTCEHAWDEKTG